MCPGNKKTALLGSTPRILQCASMSAAVVEMPAGNKYFTNVCFASALGEVGEFAVFVSVAMVFSSFG
jgi:hypothetical protein